MKVNASWYNETLILVQFINLSPSESSGHAVNYYITVLHMISNTDIGTCGMSANETSPHPNNNL